MAAESGCSMCSEKVQGQGLGKVRVNVAWRLCGGQQMPEGCSHAKVGGLGLDRVRGDRAGGLCEGTQMAGGCSHAKVRGNLLYTRWQQIASGGCWPGQLHSQAGLYGHLPFLERAKCVTDSSRVALHVYFGQPA